MIDLRQLAALGIAASVMLAPALATAKPAPAKLEIGKPAPAFEITTFDKQKVSLADLKGQVVVINYWATWCAPCKAEMPMMDRYHRIHAKNGFRIFAVTTEGSVPQYQLKRLSDALSFPLASKLKGKDYGVLGGVPTNYVIDRQGVVRYAKATAFSEAEFKALILPLLAEPRSN